MTQPLAQHAGNGATPLYAFTRAGFRGSVRGDQLTHGTTLQLGDTIG